MQQTDNLLIGTGYRAAVEEFFDDAPLLELGPDIATCDNGVQVLRAGPGVVKYRWSDAGSDSTITTLFPGTYRVEVWDACGNKQSDTVVISILPSTVLDPGPDLAACAGVQQSFTLPAGYVPDIFYCFFCGVVEVGTVWDGDVEVGAV